MAEKKEKKKWWLILFIVFIMIGTSFSFIFFGFSPQNDVVRHNGIKFAKNPSQNIWIARVNGREAAFSFLPSEVQSIPMPADSAAKLKNKFEIDTAYDLNSTYKEAIALAQHQMGLTLNAYSIYVRKGFTANNTFSMPVITCNDATSSAPVIYFRHGNVTGIHSDSNCIIAEAAANADFIRVKDRLLYGILGVLE